MTRVISYAMERVVGAARQPIIDDGGVTWCQPTVTVADYELLNCHIVQDLSRTVT